MKKNRYFGLSLFMILVVMGLATYPAIGSNNIQDIDSINANTSSTASTPWFFDTVDSSYDVGQHVSIALDHSNATPYISYYDADHEALKMAKYVGSGGNCGTNEDWACEFVDHTLNVGKFSSIAIDPLHDLPKIAYYDDTNNALKLATYNLSSWNIKTIDDPLISDAGRFASLATNPTVKVGIAYYFSQIPGIDSLRYATYIGSGQGNCGGGDYSCDIVDSGEKVGQYASLALDSADRPHIAYYDGDNGMLKYAYYDYNYSDWAITQIAGSSEHPVGQYASLAIDVNHGDMPHIAYYGDNDTLGYAYFVGSGGNCGQNGILVFEWQCSAIDFMDSGNHPRGISLALDGAGYPIIAYQSGDSTLKMARPVDALNQLMGNCGPETPYYTWQCDVISIGFGISQGDYISLAINASDLSTIAYYGAIEPADGDLHIAYQRFQIWLPLTLNN